MMLTFFDMHDRSNPQNGSAVHERGDLLKMLENLRDREPFLAELVGQNGYKLTIGIGRMGCVQYSRSDDELPYLMAVESATAEPGNHQEFLAGNEPTEVPRNYLLPFERVKEIAAYFQHTGERSPAVSWEEI
jgi:hypothetical protein